MATWIGFNPPFLSGNVILPFQTDERLIKNDLMQLLLTSPGERVMRPDFGAGIRHYMFEPITDQSAAALRSNIADAIAKFEPRVDISNIDLIVDESNHLVEITVMGKLAAPINRSIRVDLNLK